MKPATKVTVLGIIANLFLFFIKFIAAWYSSSLAVFSDAMNSLSDVITAIAIFFGVKIAHQKPDKKHPFGHHRAEPIAALMVAIFAGIVAVEIVKRALVGLFQPPTVTTSLFVLSLVILSLLVKIILSEFFIRYGKKYHSPAIEAGGIDSRNDVLVTSLVLIDLLLVKLHILWLDPLLALVIAGFIATTAWQLYKQNIDFLMGKTPDDHFLEAVKEKALRVRGVKGIHDVRAHYVGNYIHVEIHIEVNKNLSTKRSHTIGKKVKEKLQSFPAIDWVFVHIDPI